MKSNMNKKGSTSQAASRTRKVKKHIKTQKKIAHKASGVLPGSATEVLGHQLSESKPSMGTRKETVEVDPLAMIKLQLYPVDEVTRIGLEKDGHNPFLELTFKARKKISSVIKHIHTKWGGSSIAIGEPMLLPCDVSLRHSAMSRRWTSKDTIITAGDVHTAVESPAIFCLSYGWFSDHEPRRVSAATAPLNCRLSENMPKQIEKTEERKCLDANAIAEVALTVHMDNEDNRSHTDEFPQRHDDITILTLGGLLSDSSGMEKFSNSVFRPSRQPISLCTDICIGGLFAETSLQGKHQNNDVLVFKGMCGSHHQTPIQLDDSLTALSIGGLLSEASLLDKINKSNPNSNKTCISDSLDAIIFSKLKSSPKPSSLETQSLDAEETCHAFAFLKFSSNINVRVSARASQDLSSNSFRFPHLPEVEKAVHAEEASCPEPKMEPFPVPQQSGEDSKSLGLRGITWNESLGPFDLGNSRPWKVSDGNSMPWKVSDSYIKDSKRPAGFLQQ